MNGKSISVVVPCFNEGKTVFENINKVADYLGSSFTDYEIIAVNDGSQDDTLLQLERLGKFRNIKVIDNRPNKGKGRAVKDGILASEKEIVMFLDADLAIPIEGLPAFIDALESGVDIAIASRFIPGLKILKPVLWYRKFMEKVFRLLRILIINNYGIRDTQCGFKVFKRSAAMAIFPLMTVERFAFDSEIIFLGRKMGFSIKELPISLQNPAESHVRIVRDSLNMLKDLVRIRLNDITGRYKTK